MGFGNHDKMSKLSTADLIAELKRLNGIINDPKTTVYDKGFYSRDARTIARILESRR